MLDPDISTEDALALLSSTDVDDERPGPGGWTRRTFLGAVGAGAFSGVAAGSLAGDLFGGVPEAWAGAPLGANEGVLVMVTLYGGFDGLNVVVPYTDPTYLGPRRNGVRIAPADVRVIDDRIGLAPQLNTMKQMYDAGKVAIVQGVGYANPNLSHFSSMAIWMRGWMGGASPVTGWIGRWLDGLTPQQADLAAAVLSSSVPLHMQGAVRSAVGIPPDGSMFGSSTNAAERRMYTTLRNLSTTSAGRGAWHDQFTRGMAAQVDLAAKVAPTFVGTPPGGGEFQRKLTVAARLINADLGLRVVDVSGGGFDTHTDQHLHLPLRLADIDAGLASFFNELTPSLRDRVTLMVFSEFGRTIGGNATLGTDHGTANPMFLIGDRVKGGLYGAMPSLTDVTNIGRMKPQLDFRHVYGTVVDSWLGGGGSTVLGANFTNLGLFNAAPGPIPVPVVVPPVVTAPAPPPAPVVAPAPAPAAAPAPAPVPSAVMSDRTLPAGFVPCPPARLVDTRDGTGGRATRLGRDETWTLSLSGRFGIPADATSALLNITTVHATAPSYLLVWSGDTPRPLASSMTVVADSVKASLIVTKLSASGNCVIYNLAGEVDVVIDLVGWFSPTSTVGIHSQTPKRLLDTRDSSTPIAGSSALTAPVRGWAGVPEQAVAVAMNVTVTEPTAATFLTVWPGRETRPGTSNLNARPNDTVPNLVVTGLGADGSVGVFNNAGSAHLVLDVVASFVPGAPGRLVAIDPVRIHDTREGQAGRVGSDRFDLPVLGRAGVPATGVVAVVLTVTVVEPDRNTFVTVFPSGPKRPATSNLNVSAGSISSNLVIAAVGEAGAVAVRNHHGSAHLVVDVVGYVTG